MGGPKLLIIKIFAPYRPTDKLLFFISQPKHMLLVRAQKNHLNETEHFGLPAWIRK